MDLILHKLMNSGSKGAFLEEILEDILYDLNFINIARQKSGAQYGYDLIATKRGNRNEIWKFECKNLSNSISIDDIAPKLIWHLGNDPIDRFVIVSVSEVSSYLKQLFEKIKLPIHVEIWSGGYLIEQISKSPRALKRLGIEHVPEVKTNQRAVIYEPEIISFDAFYSEKLPYSVEYFITDKGLTKAYTDVWFNITAVFCNNSKTHPFVCTEINVKTLNFSKVQGRIFRQSKLKGIEEPVKYKFVPSVIPLKTVPILNPDQVFEVKVNKDDFFTFELDRPKATPGYYELIFEVIGRLNGREITMYSSVFPLYVSDPNDDRINLYTVGKFYDTVSQDILNLPAEKWNKIRDKEKEKSTMTYLGPTMLDVIKGIKDKKWHIRTIEGTSDNENGFLNIGSDEQSKVFIELDLPIQEPIYNREDSFAKILGQNWQNKLPNGFQFPS